MNRSREFRAQFCAPRPADKTSPPAGRHRPLLAEELERGSKASQQVCSRLEQMYAELSSCPAAERRAELCLFDLWQNASQSKAP